MGRYEKKYSEDEVLKYIAELSQDEVLGRDAEYVKNLDIDDELLHIEPDPTFLEFAREYDKKNAKKDNAQKYRKPLQVVAAVLICFVVVFSLTLEESEAFRVRIYNLLFNDKSGSVTLLTSEDSDLIGGWKDYWYPTYKPDGMELIAAENDGERKIQLYSSDDRNREVRIMEVPLEDKWDVDTDTNSIETIEIGIYSGYLFEDSENNHIKLFWMTEDRQIILFTTGLISKEEAEDMARGLKYIT